MCVFCGYLFSYLAKSKKLKVRYHRYNKLHLVWNYGTTCLPRLEVWSHFQKEASSEKDPPIPSSLLVPKHQLTSSHFRSKRKSEKNIVRVKNVFYFYLSLRPALCQVALRHQRLPDFSNQQLLFTIFFWPEINLRMSIKKHRTVVIVVWRVLLFVKSLL
jgi:hypothetical protein